ncbi:MAG TPA: hypothetical protein VKB19_19530 [Pedobacter sp.]|nr:hypothetical protein [Pedobacter sp.]
MPDKNKLSEDLRHFEQLNAKDEQLIQKLDEFMILLKDSSLDSENIRGLKTQINEALDHKLGNGEVIEDLKEISLSNAMDKMDQLDQLENLLNSNYIDSRQLKNNKLKEGISKTMKAIIGFLFITMGFAMIIMPAPPYFEMFTIFYFSTDDGVTLMDLISLIIIAIGIFIVIGSFLKVKKV